MESGAGMKQEWGEYLSYAAAERYTELSRSTLWRMLRRGEIKAVKVGASVRIVRESLDAYLAAHAWEPDENDKAL